MSRDCDVELYSNTRSCFYSAYKLNEPDLLGRLREPHWRLTDQIVHITGHKGWNRNAMVPSTSFNLVIVQLELTPHIFLSFIGSSRWSVEKCFDMSFILSWFVLIDDHKILGVFQEFSRAVMSFFQELAPNIFQEQNNKIKKTILY